jgi:hypothetical protein
MAVPSIYFCVTFRPAEPGLMPDSNPSQGHGLSSPGQSSVASAPVPESTARDAHQGLPAPVTRGQIWMHRVLVLLFVFVCAAAGVLLVILPWTSQWTDNVLLLRYPSLRVIMSNGFFRGLCSGLGLLDIWIGFSEAIHYHEDKLPGSLSRNQ